LDGIVTGCREHGLQEKIMVLPADRQPQGRAADPSTFAAHDALRHCAGIIVLGTLPVTLLLKLQQPGAPLILVDHEEPLMNADCVLNANLQAAHSACRHLLSRDCKSLVFLGKDSFSISFKERWWGCRQAMDEHARTTEGCTLKKWTLPYGLPGWEQHLTKRILSLEAGQLPDGFVCANDQIAIALLAILQQSSVNVPVDCKVCGIDNIDESAASDPPLTTVELAKEYLGYRAVEALARKINRPGYHGEKIILSARLIPRGSG
jgi:LacI family transcriptional regulator